MVDDVEQFQDSVLEVLLLLVFGINEGCLYVFLFGELLLLLCLEVFFEGEECFYVIELQLYSEEEICDYLVQCFEGVGQGIELIFNDLLVDIYEQLEGWLGVINQVVCDVLIEVMLVNCGVVCKVIGGFFNLFKKYLVIFVVVVIGVIVVWFM